MQLIEKIFPSTFLLSSQERCTFFKSTKFCDSTVLASSLKNPVRPNRNNIKKMKIKKLEKMGRLKALMGLS